MLLQNLLLLMLCYLVRHLVHVLNFLNLNEVLCSHVFLLGLLFEVV